MAAFENVMSRAPPKVEYAGAATSLTRDRAGAGGRGRNGCGAGGAGLRGTLGGAARPGGPAGGKAELEMGCPVVGAPSAQAQKLAGSSASFRPRSSREGFLEEEE